MPSLCSEAERGGERQGSAWAAARSRDRTLVAYSGPALVVGDAGSDLLAANLGSRQVVQPTARGIVQGGGLAGAIC